MLNMLRRVPTHPDSVGIHTGSQLSLEFIHLQLLYKGLLTSRPFIYFINCYDEGPMLETLDYTIRIGSTPTFLYFDLHNCYSSVV